MTKLRACAVGDGSMWTEDEMDMFDNEKIAPPELDAATRTAVLAVRGTFLAYVASGFTEEQAMELVKVHLSVAAKQ